MSPAVVALARAFSKTDLRADEEDENSTAEQTSAELIIGDSPQQYVKSKSRASSFVSSISTCECASSLIQRCPSHRHQSPGNSPPAAPLLYHYDPYHQYCRTGSDYYKSYHLSYQAYCHSSKCAYGTDLDDSLCREQVDAILKPTNKLAAARARATRLRRKLSEFRVARALTRIQRLALGTITVTILAFIFSRSLIPTQIPGFISPTQFR